ncbi:aminoglycoside phosphotransferase family protein [Mycolicibacterium sp. GF69]|uniref:phosphotransferase n=1 Tax=Mycolicibacterium sp. GF69 TaxID=2267251 RepID=UPI000DCD8A35|nr:phosphotransferase [Mycolicibacterium sp. GF69]RAV18206.1 aminoglycoside phosphotransferase family protein [Mycolicibacterium sp. GF69]
MTPPQTPALSLLLGPRASDVLATAVDNAAAGQLHGVRPTAVHVQPSGAAAVRYAAELRRDDGTRVPDILVATTGDEIPDGAAVVAGEHLGAPVEVGIWRWLHDPALPALAVAGDGARLAEVLRAAGLTSATALQLRLRTYRPGQRAVLEVVEPGTDPPRTWFVKVVRPDALAALRDRHELLSPVVPVPAVLTDTPDGLVVFGRADGAPLRDLLMADEPVPGPAALGALLDALPAGLLDFPRCRSALERVDTFAAVLRHTVEPDAPMLAGLDDVVAQLSDPVAGAEETVPVHGDFYEGQLLADGGRISGLLDVDTAGPGVRADDWATLLAHLLTAAMANDRPPVRRYTDAVREHVRGCLDPAELRRRTAAGLLGLATGPFRQQRPNWAEHTAERIRLAADWLAGGG